MIPCPTCTGRGTTFRFVDYADGTAFNGFVPCDTCHGTGTIDQAQSERIAAGQQLRDDRRARRVTLGQEAARLGIEPHELAARCACISR